jgi:AAA15 family ATPase/GTPase
MKFENTQVFNIEGAMRGMRFPMKGIGDTCGDLIGDSDMTVAKKLYRASELDNFAHSKFLRQIFVSVDVSAPIYFWSEMDTYKVGTVANSESTMHKLTKDAKNLNLEDFEYETAIVGHYLDKVAIPFLQEISSDPDLTEIAKLRILKQTLPTSYIQKRHWTGNYEIIRNMYRQRRNHRLREWSEDFTRWAENLPYADEFITCRIKEN